MDLFTVSGKVAVVTGGARGIGFALAEGLAGHGATVVIADINEEQAQTALKALKEMGCASGAVRVDVTDEKSVKSMTETVIKQFGRIDVLVNCAGIIVRNPIASVTEAEWSNIMDVNVKGLFLCCQTVGKEMIKRKQGRIINISSNIVQPLQVGRGAYAVSKAAVSQLTRVMALEWAPHNINVNAIAPGPTITDFNRPFFDANPEDLKMREQSIPMGRLGDPKDYIGVTVMLASGASNFLTGQTIFVDGGSNLI